jgi:hypothetical protein
MPNRTDAELSEIVYCQSGHKVPRDVILAKLLRVLFQSESPEPIHNVHCVVLPTTTPDNDKSLETMGGRCKMVGREI